jgi:hypothetical protein
VKGVLFTVQKALPLIPAGGAIVLNASIVSVQETRCTAVLRYAVSENSQVERLFIQQRD